ncbi:beta-lactamase family protein [Massilia sp. Dwa41.01b]|uniref:serine hydrolase domain-containing protein n=1 Tax=unclassified Massilia TaxID=2609279 RepID=UPI00160297BB|nr:MULTISPECIES: serine hydrolase domain-containing protein [unclassified Massilia]QNA90159.1 beta-lactamase family protein [Massilia sp. Dwa41.01b]QNB01049.1 beta-lactamase family protein [Massilia sp. Se16.2.3]
MKRNLKHLALLLCFPLAVMAAPVEPKLADSLDSLMAARFKPDQPGVAALVMKDGQPILRKAYGMANVELGVKAQPEHVFRIGSTTKLFTATAVMLLVDEGKLALDAPVSRYLSDAPAHWEKVTIEHLLTHTSGIPNLSLDSGYWRTSVRLDHTPKELVDPVRARPLESASGTRFAYNNTGYHLLGLIIEKVSGKPYYTFLDERISKPLGLRHTREGSDKAFIPGLVTGYGKGPAPAWLLSNSNFYAGGGVVSTVDDMAAFMIALQGGKLVSPANVRRMNTPYVLPNGQATGYGFGTWLREINGKHLVGHGGYIINFYSELEMDVDSGIVAVTLHNGDMFGGDNEELSRELISAVQGSATQARQ